jgi:LPS O-antigen subunit length determinant protein (WzzB/FepE family)
MHNVEELSPELQEAVKMYRQSGQEVLRYDKKVMKFNLDDDYQKLQEAVKQRNIWQAKIKELIKGREKELNWVLIG